MAGALKEITPREDADEVHAVFETNMGTFKVRLFHDKAPKTVQNFIDLAEGSTAWVDPKTRKESTAPYYDGVTFHRIIPGFVIQGGCPIGDGRGGPGYRFEDEFHPDLRHTKAGILSMANAGPDTNGSQFFVTLAATPHLDNRHAVFGEVVEGMDVVEEIGNVPTGPGDKPREPVVMEKVRIERS
ncbi:MAG: peptidylprolyl isomerase [Myxococcota bacterium]